jgi:hypothetical protein
MFMHRHAWGEAAPLNTELEDQHPSAAGQLPELQDSDSG